MATMNGIDISAFQNGIDLSKIKADFIIIRATKGAAKDGSFDDFIGQIKKLKKPYGIYHIAYPQYNSAAVEAEAYIKVAKPFFGKMIPILDWETKGVNNVGWALDWLQRVEKASGVKPMIYMSESVENTYDWSKVVKGNYSLWIAKYRDYIKDKNYDMSLAGNKPVLKHWKTYAMWQWTSSGQLTGYSGNLDLDIFYGSKTQWNKYAGVKTSTKKKTTAAKKTVDQLAKEVIDGKWGNGADREKKLTAAGYDYAAVQKKVNELLAPKKQIVKKTPAIKTGDTVAVVDPIIYGTSRRFTCWYRTYKVMQVTGDRAVIGRNGVVTAAINVKNLKKVI